MNNMTNEIVAIKTEVRERKWKELSMECQQSGLSVKDWCRQNGIHPSTYYARLRKLREKMCRDIVAIESEAKPIQLSEIKVTSGEIVVSLPVNASAETISTVLRALKTLKELAIKRTVYLVTGYTDLRNGIDGLAAFVQGRLSISPFEKQLFLFCGRRRDRIKGLLWEGDGFLLLYKRLDNGVFRWPRNETEARLQTEQEIRWLLEGLEIDQPKAIKPGKKLRSTKKFTEFLQTFC